MSTDTETRPARRSRQAERLPATTTEPTRRTAQRRSQEDMQPDFTVRARSGRGWAQVGAAWKPDRDGNVVMSIKINNIPVGFDGVLKILLPLAPDDPGEDTSDMFPDTER